MATKIFAFDIQFPLTKCAKYTHTLTQHLVSTSLFELFLLLSFNKIIANDKHKTELQKIAAYISGKEHVKRKMPSTLAIFTHTLTHTVSVKFK